MLDFAPDGGSAHSSPNSVQNEYDTENENVDSSSSSSGDHSSPSDDSVYASPSAHPGSGWPYDMTGLSIPTLVGLPTLHDEWAPSPPPAFGLAGGKAHSHFANGDALFAAMEDDPNGLALTSDFWSTAPTSTAQSPADYHHLRHHDPAHSDLEPRSQAHGEMQVEFDDVVHDDVCGPSSVASPAQSFSDAPAYTARSPSDTPSSAHPSQYLFTAFPMGIPLNLLAVNASIAPELMGGQRSPPLDAFREIGSSSSGSAASSERERDTRVDQDELEGYRGSTSRDGSEDSSRDTSVSRKPLDEPMPISNNFASSSSAPPTTTNLVAKDAVVAASVIPTLVAPPPSSIISQASSGLKLLVLGVPTVGAKSRVETQIKISLVLVGPKDGNRAVKAEDGDEASLMTADGGLVDSAGDGLERIGSWSHVRLPKFLALKKKNKKQTKLDPAPENTLFLDVAVVRGSEPFEEIFICTGCQQRELKRAQRKKDARVRPTNESAEQVATYGTEEDEERRKVVVFNCAEYVDFTAGETVLPTRITCYCRHHKERRGFSVAFTLRTASGIVVASGSTPPIMITDDHKTSIRPPMGDVSVESIELPKVANPAKRAKAGKPDKLPEVPVSTRPKRTGVRQKASRGAIESDEEVPAAAPYRPAAKKAAPKPYDSESRPRKRQSGVHRSPSFAMTPLAVSKPGSPVPAPARDPSPPPPVPATIFESAPAEMTESWESALGLGGMCDATMQDVPRHDSIASSAFSNAYSAASSTAPSPAQSNDWRSNASSPTGQSIDSFSSLFSGIASPPTMASPHPPLRSPPLQQHLQQEAILSSTGNFASLYNPSVPAFPGNAFSAVNWSFPPSLPALPPPRISRLIPGEGPVHGGIEVTVLGENFVRDLTVVFGDSAAVPTHFWSSNTLVCILPPSANPGPVVVGIKGVPLTVDQGTGLQLFTYKDDSDRSLLELALQVVGLKMTGRLEDASAVAMRIVGNNNGNSSSSVGSRHASPTDTNTLAGLAAFTPSSSRPSSRAPSRQASQVNLTHLGGGSPPGSYAALPHLPAAGETRNFEGIVIKFLSLLDLDPTAIPGSAPSLPLAQSPISHVNGQYHTLLHLATLLGFHRLVQFLLVRGIDIDSRDRNGFTALHFAALYGRVAITRLLVEAGATPYPRNLAGKTPLDIARARDDIDVEEVFLRSVRSSQTRRPELPRTSSSSSYSSRISQPAPAPREPELRGTYSDDSSADESSDDDDDDDDDGSFHSSDEDTDSSDLERGLSRNASIVSLHYLLDAEADADAEYTPAAQLAPVTTDEESDDSESTSAPPAANPSSPTTTIDLAQAMKNWLARSLGGAPTLPFPEHGLDKRQFTHAWEKMQTNPVWEKIRPPVGFQMPELVAFPSMASMPAFAPWRSGTKSDGDAVAEGKDTKERPTWWRKHNVTSPPPPMYTPTDAHSTPSTSASTLEGMVYPPQPRTAMQPTKAQVQAKLQRRVGYAPEEISDSVVQSFVTHEKKMHRLRDDRMLAFFWLPILIILSFCALYNSYGSISPFLLAVSDAILPFARSIRSIRS